MTSSVYRGRQAFNQTNKQYAIWLQRPVLLKMHVNEGALIKSSLLAGELIILFTIKIHVHGDTAKNIKCTQL